MPPPQDRSVDEKSETAEVTGDAALEAAKIVAPATSSKGEDSDKAKPRKSRRSVKAPRKVDEIYSYEHIRLSYAKKAKAELSTPEKKMHLLSSLDHIIPFDKAAESTLYRSDPVVNPVETRPEKNEDDDNDEEDNKQWLQKVAASLGADTSALRQKRLPRTFYRSTSSLDGPLRPFTSGGPSPHVNAMKSDAACCWSLPATPGGG